MAKYGIDDEFIKKTGKKVTEDISAPILLSAGTATNKVSTDQKVAKFKWIVSNLTKNRIRAARSR